MHATAFRLVAAGSVLSFAAASIACLQLVLGNPATTVGERAAVLTGAPPQACDTAVVRYAFSPDYMALTGVTLTADQPACDGVPVTIAGTETATAGAARFVMRGGGFAATMQVTDGFLLPGENRYALRVG